MSKIKYALVVVLLILLAVCSVSAAEFTDEIAVDTARGIVTVTGKPDASRANKAVTVQVEISRNDGAEIAYVNQINADERGSFTLSFSLTSPGNYTLNLAEAGVKGIASSKFFFAHEQSQTAVLAQINSATKETIISVMKNDDVQAVMNLGDLYYSLTGSGADMTQLYYSIAEHDAFETAEDFSLWFRRSVFVYALDINDADNGANAVNVLENYGAELGASQWMGYSYYQNFDSAQREAVGKSLSSKNITLFENMENKYDEAVFMQYISSCISPGKINTLFKDIRDSGKDYGLDLTGYFSLTDTSNVDKGIYGESFAGMTALQSKLNALVAQYAKPGNNSQSGSGGGSSSSGGGSSFGGGVSNVIAVAPGYTETVDTPS
ncbi:MAG: hypothetical protein IJ365_02370, partial [Clostridia bacterium]|nr:hypothetical protein [Clostridia bacterium]